MDGPIAPRTTDGRVPLRATAWAGGLLAVATAGLLAGLVVVEVPLDHGAVIPLHGFVPQLLSAIARLAAFSVLALRAPGVVGGSALGRLALVLLGAQDLVLLLGVPVLPSFLATAVLSAAVQLVLLAAGVVAAAAVVRAGSLHGAARRLLVAVVALGVPQAALSWIPLPISADALVALAVFLRLLQLVLLLAFAAALLVHGRRGALRDRRRVVRDAW